jgi:hypothetical protein
MSAVTGFPGLSTLLSWSTEHLTEAADHWDTVGEHSYGVANQVWRAVEIQPEPSEIGRWSYA